MLRGPRVIHLLVAGAICTMVAIDAASVAPPQIAAPSMPAPLPAIDDVPWKDQQDMTWADYRPIPGTRWADPSLAPARALRVALVAIDFEDQPFVITLPKHSDPFGNPQIDPVSRADVARFYAGFLGTPGALNHGHTINEYWMEQSRGRVGIPKIDAYGPYRMPKRLFQYGLNEYNQASACPSGFTCDGRMEPDADALWTADAGADVRSKYDIVLRIYAGYDETSVWQEFGEMKFATKEDIPAAWGNPDAAKPRWVVTRYVPWTSWLAGAQQWGLSSVRQGESSGTITHEIAHFAFRTGDNNNNPYATPYRRVGSGPWDIMDRGSFNGPGGYHRRWVVPATEGASMPAGLTLRNRMRFEFVRPDQVVRLSRDGLARSGLVVAKVMARAIEPTAGTYAGIVVALDGAAPQDRTPPCDRNADPLCAGDPVFNTYTMEVVERIGYDSFTPDHGVLIAKNKNGEGNSCGYNCFTWVIDAHPEDIKTLDFSRPGGAQVMRTIADARQLNDALFHAGVGWPAVSRDGATVVENEFEWEDTPNRLHFYVIDLERSVTVATSYIVAVRSLDSAGPQTRGVRATAAPEVVASSWVTVTDVAVTNTSVSAPVAAGVHPTADSGVFGRDVFRITATAEGAGWWARLGNALVAVAAGATARVPVQIYRNGARPPGRVIVTVTSESDPSKKAVATINTR